MIWNLLPEFKKRFFDGTDLKISKQAVDRRKNKVDYFPLTKPLTDQDLLIHFSQQPKLSGDYSYGSLAVCGKFNTGRCKWVCLDADKPGEFEGVINNVIPVYEKYGIEYILELSQAGRCHLWFLCDAPYKLVELFMFQIFSEAEFKTAEVYPFGNRKDNVIRLPGGYHHKTGKANPIFFNEVESSDPEFILKAFNTVKILSEDQIRLQLTIDSIPNQPKEKKKNFVKKFFYFDRKLPEPMPNLPPLVGKMSSNCQAINKLIKDTVSNNMIDEAGIEHHNTGLFLSGLGKYNDIVLKQAKGKKWFEYLLNFFRSRDAESHHWNDQDKHLEEPHRLVPNCEKFQESFPDYCKGCPFLNRDEFWTPRQFCFNKPIEKKFKKKINLVTRDSVHLTTFSKVSKEVNDMLQNNIKGDILLASSQGIGKSVWADRVTVDLAMRDYNIIIAVPTGELAMEHKERIEARGVKCQILVSHEATFSGKTYKLPFKCPDYKDIQHYVELGVDSSFYKNKYCKTCPFLNSCPFPKQYKEALDPNIKVVIIQHAHFQSPEVLYQLFDNKRFDIMFVDESFISNTIINIRPIEEEISLLLNSGFNWATRLGEWMRDGGYAFGNLNPLVEDLEALQKIFEAAGIEWRLKTFISGFKQKEYLDEVTGLKIFFPVPYIPIRVFTDATPPLEMIKLVLNNPNIKVFGEDEVIDYTQYHPENEIIQVIDNSLSKSSLLKEEKYYQILNYIGELATTKFLEDKILITTYADKKEFQWITEAVDHLTAKFPGLDVGLDPKKNRVCISTMKVGSNAFADRTIQFLLASVYMNAKQFLMEAYDLKLIVNYWNRKMGLEEIQNRFPAEALKEENIGGLIKTEPITKVEIDGLYEYPNYKQYIPELLYEEYVYRHNIGKSQQSMRIRFNPDKNGKMLERKKVYLFGNYSFPTLLISKVCLLEDLLCELK